ncbi:MAG: toxin-antitoxin system YwqK family antitoxin [Alphaproteobacteria bacterium]|nr:toxin-antitoxin system YwqK family antitoxin [Alphaproteobacteria bacterium]
MTRPHSSALLSLAALLVLPSLAGCPRRGGVTAMGRDTEVVQTVLGCAPGAREYGAAPPAGFELWCGVPGDTGAVRHGPSRSWWQDGARRTAGAYDMGRKTGHWFTWHANGNLASEGPYVGDAEDGYWMLYDEDGDLAEEGPMHDGGREGVWSFLDPKTKVWLQGTWVDGQKDGTWTEYDAAGKPLRERVFRLGRQISQREL